MVEFVKEVRKLKDVKRTGWILSGIQNPESVADHSFAVTVLSYVFAKRLGLDENKTVKLALIHDLCEIHSGDIPPNAGIPEDEKRRREDEGLEKIVSLLDRETKNEITSLWKELREGRTEEAKLVKDIDKLDMCVQALAYSEKYDNLERFVEDAKRSVRSPEIRKILEQLCGKFSKQQDII